MLKFGSHSERGGGHSENEDFLLRERYPGGGGRYLCFVADGQGGRADGSVASKTACEAAFSFASELLWDDFSLASTWDRVFKAADRAVQDTCDGFTTLIGFAADEESIRGASIGDSKAYYHDGEVFVDLTERQHKNPPIGAGCDQSSMFSIDELKGTVLAVTDGVWKYSGFEALRDAASKGEVDEIPRILREALVSRQGANLPDDFSVMAVATQEVQWE